MSPSDKKNNACAFADAQLDSESKPSVCFVALNAYNVLSGRDDINHVGGAEVQQVRIARWLVQRGYSVSFVTLDHGQRDGIDHGGIRVFKAYRTAAGLRGLRFIHPRWSGLWAALARANADVYYHRCAEAETGQVALWCRLHGCKFVSASAHDSDCDLQLLRLRHPWMERVLYRVGIRLADGITVQTLKQGDLFSESIGIATTLVRNCCWNLQEVSPSEAVLPRDPGARRVLWIGRIDSSSKRFGWLLDIAEKCPESAFEVVGAANGRSDEVASLVKRSEQTPNVNVCGWVPYTEMTAYYRRCHILCCTSEYEGFPNTFLEAWTMGIPVVTTFDPDGVVAANGLGWVAESVDDAAACVTRALSSPALWAGASRAARNYCLEHFAAEVCLPPLEHLFQKVTATR